MEALLCINQEYEYSNYFLTRELCLQVLADMNARNRIRLQREDSETDYDMLETPRFQGAELAGTQRVAETD